MAKQEINNNSDCIISLREKKISRSDDNQGEFYKILYKDTILDNIDFTDVDFDTDYGGLMIKNCEFNNCLFDKIIFYAMKFEQIVFKNCRFVDAGGWAVGFQDVVFDGCSFEGSNLFSHTSLKSCDMRNSDLKGIQFEEYCQIDNLKIDDYSHSTNRSVTMADDDPYDLYGYASDWALEMDEYYR